MINHTARRNWSPRSPWRPRILIGDQEEIFGRQAGGHKNSVLVGQPPELLGILVIENRLWRP